MALLAQHCSHLPRSLRSLTPDLSSSIERTGSELDVLLGSTTTSMDRRLSALYYFLR